MFLKRMTIRYATLGSILLLVGAFLMRGLFINPESLEAVYSNEDKKLKHFISLLEKEIDKPWSTLQPPHRLKAGSQHSSVIELRKRLQSTGELAKSEPINNTTFDENVKNALEHYQRNHGLEVTGEVDDKTLKALNISPQRRLRQLQKNYERWVQFQQKRQQRFLWINIPSFSAELIEKNKVILNEKVIVGKPSHPTPLLDSEITEIMLNPYWVVPASLAQRTIIPKLSENPNLLHEKKMQVYDAKTSEPISFNDLNFDELSKNINDYFFRQEPGPLNPLGQIKFKITNSSSIYMHDTNTKNLFNEHYRALSAGCIRLQNPLNLFTKIGEQDESINQIENQLKKLERTSESHNIKLQKSVPIMITYMTAWVDDKGYLQVRDDLYEQDFS